jgi:putative endonuclease
MTGVRFVIPTNAGIQKLARRRCWIPEPAPDPIRGQARNDGAGFVFPANAGIQYASPMKQPCVYILASRRNGTLYVGVTSNLVQRVWQHKNDLVDGFTKKYGAHTLVWFEVCETMESAIAREKTIKGWQRKWKLDLIEEANPAWRDLYGDVV